MSAKGVFTGKIRDAHRAHKQKRKKYQEVATPRGRGGKDDQDATRKTGSEKRRGPGG